MNFLYGVNQGLCVRLMVTLGHFLCLGRGPLLVCLSGRGDKDVAHVARVEGRGSLLGP